MPEMTSTEMMSPHELRELADSLWLKEQCSRLLHGQCSTRRCLVRGGYGGKGPVNLDGATCEPYEIWKALHAAANDIDDYQKALISGYPANKVLGDAIAPVSVRPRSA